MNIHIAHIIHESSFSHAQWAPKWPSHKAFKDIKWSIWIMKIAKLDNCDSNTSIKWQLSQSNSPNLLGKRDIFVNFTENYFVFYSIKLNFCINVVILLLGDIHKIPRIFLLTLGDFCYCGLTFEMWWFDRKRKQKNKIVGMHKLVDI